MKPTVTIKRKFGNGVIQSVELFKYKHGVVLHRHELTKDEDRARLIGIHRVFGKSFYCQQEIMLLNDEIKLLKKYIGL